MLPLPHPKATGLSSTLLHATKIALFWLRVTLLHAAAEDPEGMTSWLNCTLKHPAIVLEDIRSATRVQCPDNQVSVTFDNQDDFEKITTLWPQNNFILITNHGPDCNDENERGLHKVESISFDRTSMTLVAQAGKTSFVDITEEMAIEFSKPVTDLAKPIKPDTPAQPQRRDFLSDSINYIAGVLNINATILAPSLEVVPHELVLEGNLAMRGYMKYVWGDIGMSEAYIEVRMGLTAATGVNVTGQSEYLKTPFSLVPIKWTFAPIMIPGIVAIGPALTVGTGAEVSTSEPIDISFNITTGLTEGFAHIDLLNPSKSTSSGWSPSYTEGLNVTKGAEVEVHPIFDLEPKFAFEFLLGLIYYSVGIRFRAKYFNYFTLQPASENPPPTSDALSCPGGSLLSNSFAFTINFFVWRDETEMFKYEEPTTEPRCVGNGQRIIGGAPVPKLPAPPTRRQTVEATW
ncbi:isoamyl alcohol oxidase [Drepanopeziza brunnea f. sp. 'multigermtubi' MB_m1]|uniref:Isoamyl alcohol oxidase n=1 Tax=Marssonina brunnea f. sp. multigermtubi (strain MB_m1) TaxID=1072389 RepID=K1XU01_MARBU|nr:isoamyl alcohol oxidase [Drepanopeziza brunnea f. sp. 'multigermtubi' MB_m1]EKD16084.1 isoamyl alcohol oxidase [Drepanopeziza brunnea f. sp. 'multigermtubi' MB_m1]